MNSFHKDVINQLKHNYKGIKSIIPPRWLARSRWKPLYCLAFENDSRVIAIDMIPSANLPKAIYKEEVLPLIRSQPKLRVIVCVLEKKLDYFSDTETFCKNAGIGLHTLIPGVGLQTVVTTDIDSLGVSSVYVEPGWFPQQIIANAKDLTKLSFYEKINSFLKRLESLGNDEVGVTTLVMTTVDDLFQYYPKCHPNIGSFMKLAHFESLFRKTVPNSSEHVLHSFRVFLIGCIVLNHFYDEFYKAHKHFCVGTTRSMSVEYCWLLTAIFHDIGRPMEGSRQMLEEELEDDDIAISVVGKDTRWIKEHYSQARRILSSLGVFVATSQSSNDHWDGGAVSDDEGTALGVAWTALYDNFSSHSVISAFNMLSNIIEQARAVDEIKNRPFVITHAAPAALAILLHDWRIWEEAKHWKLYPVDSKAIPMAALLIFIDTWDDFKRKGCNSPISIESFVVDSSGVSVTIKWHNIEDYEKEKFKYTAFKKALKNHFSPMKINAQVETA